VTGSALIVRPVESIVFRTYAVTPAGRGAVTWAVVASKVALVESPGRSLQMSLVDVV
jgi:hypothetical protein